MNLPLESNLGGLGGRTALVTGASAGLGFAAAMSLARRGAKVAISSRGGAKLEAARAELEATGAEVLAVEADVRRPGDLRSLVAKVQQQWGAIDVLVANGGGPRAKPALELDDSDWEEALALALLFVPRLCRLVIHGMRERGWGRVVAINSVSTKQPIPGLALSNALRPAVAGYLKTLALEVAGDGITVNSVLPGYTRTERQTELIEAMSQQREVSREEVVAGWTSQIAMGRLAEPHEIGEVVGFLCSPAASYLTGQAVTVDGGYTKGLT